VGATKAAAYAAAPITNPTTLAATTTNAGYCGIAGAADLLGNKTTLTAAQQATACGTEANNATFGVDRVAPVVGYGAAAIAANARISTGTIGGEEIVTFADTGLVGNSGMNPATPVVASLQTRNTGAVTCPAGTLNTAGTACTLSTTGMTTTVVTGSSTTGVAGTSVIAYYTFNATATDAAGNSASVSPRVFVFDNTAPVVGAANTPVSVSAVGFNASAFVSEDLDIQSFTWGVNYATFPFAPLQFAQGGVTQVNGYNANPFINTNYVASSAVTLPLAFQAAAAATLYPLSTVQLIAMNQGNLAVAGAAAGPTTVAPGTALSTVGFTSYPADFLPAGITGLSSGVTTAATAAAPLTSTLSATAVGLTATFNNPFTRVDFYAVNVAGTQWVLIGSSATPSLVDIGGNRTFTWTLPVSGAALYTQLGFSATATVNVIGVGMGASNTAIGMIPAATFGLNIIK
jgi:large repetitive protein